jgi:hypothetical protein
MGTRGGGMVLCFFAVLAVGARSQEVIDADNPPIWGDSPTLVEEVRIGGIDGPVEYVFGEVDGVLATPAGEIWVERYVEGEEQSETPGEEAQRVKMCKFWGMSSAECDEGIGTWRDPLVYDVVSAEGEFQGRVRFPNRRSHLWQASGRTLWVTEQGEYGETYVIRYHVAGS